VQTVALSKPYPEAGWAYPRVSTLSYKDVQPTF
jgi:hypothetical protein